MAKKSKEAEASTPAKDVVTVTWPGSARRPAGSREYSKAIHGDDFKKLAEGFAEKVGGKVA